MKEMLDRSVGTCYNDRMVARVENAYTEEQAEKYRQMVLYVIKSGASRNGKIPKTKLAKEIYLADFIWFYENNEPMSYMEYRKREFGPLPDIFLPTIEDMEYKGIVKCELKPSQTDKSKYTQLYSLADKNVVFDKLTEEEKLLIEQIGEAWRNEKPSKIIEFTHKQLPWSICRDGEVIPYTLIIQEESADVYGPVQLRSNI